VATYQQVLRSVTYNNIAIEPTLLARTIVFKVNDGSNINNLSNNITKTINLLKSSEQHYSANIISNTYYYSISSITSTITSNYKHYDVSALVAIVSATTTVARYNKQCTDTCRQQVEEAYY
jgi:hypothetical protein